MQLAGMDINLSFTVTIYSCTMNSSPSNEPCENLLPFLDITSLVEPVTYGALLGHHERYDQDRTPLYTIQCSVAWQSDLD
jgi:hypothetical protein